MQAGGQAVSLDGLACGRAVSLAGREAVCLVGRLVVELSAWLVKLVVRLSDACLIGWFVVSLWSACQLGLFASDWAVFLVNWLVVRLSARMARVTAGLGAASVWCLRLPCGTEGDGAGDLHASVCTYVCIVIDVCFCVVWDFAFQFELEWLTGGEAVYLVDWLVVGLCAWMVGWWSGCQREWLARWMLG